MIRNYYNSAILTCREVINGIDKNRRLSGETRQQSNTRRKKRLNKYKQQKKRNKQNHV